MHTQTERLPYRAPLFPDSLFGHLAATAVPGVEEWRDGAVQHLWAVGDHPVDRMPEEGAA